ncbi:MAG: lasso peptide biosynthesis protein [Acidimicrobiales bacterium]
MAPQNALAARVGRASARFHPSVLAGALWAGLAARLVRRELKRAGVRAWVLPPPAWLGPRASRGVKAALRRLEPTCLEKALVLQAWLASQGTLRDVVIGVPPTGMSEQPAHAWVDGLDPVSPANYLEMHRLPAHPGRGRARL